MSDRHTRQLDSLEEVYRYTISEMAFDLGQASLTLAGFAPRVSYPVMEEAIGRMRIAAITICQTFREAEKHRDRRAA